MKLRTVAFYFTAISLLSLFFCGYSLLFPESDTMSQILSVKRLLNPQFLAQDWFLNATMQGNVHRFFADRIIAALAGLTSFEWAHFLYYCSGLLVFPWLGYGIVRSGFGGDRVSGFLAGLLLLTVHNGSLSSTQLYPTAFREPIYVALAAPLSLGVVLLFLKNRAISGVAAASVLSLLHPLIGFFSGAISLGALMYGHVRQRKLARSHIVAALLMLLLGLLWFAQSERSPSTEEQYFEVFRARYPHHYWASAYPWSDWISFFGVQLVLALSLWQLRNRLKKEKLDFAYAFSIMILSVCLAGFVFVEWIPIKGVLTAQAFRYVYLESVLALCLFAMGGIPLQLWSLLVIALLLAAVGSFWLEAAYLVIALSVFAIELRARKEFKIFIRSVVGLTLVAAFASQSEWEGPLKIAFFDQKLDFNIEADRQRVFREEPSTLTGIQSAELYRMADYARSHTPESAIFIVPPTWAAFRAISERALVVDPKCILVSDPEEWRVRMAAVYGFDTSVVNGDFWKYLFSMEESYRSISDSRLESVKEKYGPTFAVLARETPSAFPSLFESKEFKLVSLMRP